MLDLYWPGGYCTTVLPDGTVLTTDQWGKLKDVPPVYADLLRQHGYTDTPGDLNGVIEGQVVASEAVN